MKSKRVKKKKKFSLEDFYVESTIDMMNHYSEVEQSINLVLHGLGVDAGSAHLNPNKKPKNKK